MYAAATNKLKPTYQHPIHQYINILQHKVCYNIFQTDQACHHIYSFLNLLYNHVHVNEGNKFYFILFIYLFSELCRTLALSPLSQAAHPLSHTWAWLCVSHAAPPLKQVYSAVQCTMYTVQYFVQISLEK